MRYHYTLKTIRGETMTLDNLYRNVDKLAGQIEQKVVEVLEPYFVGKIAKGESIPFSDTLRLTNAGLQEGSRELAWEQFGGYKTGGGRMTLLAQDGSEWFSLPLPEIDNIPILIHFLRDHTS